MTLLSSISLITGIWRATLSLPGAELPFNFELKKNKDSYTIEIIMEKKGLLLMISL
jgi:hypothetical protein